MNALTISREGDRAWTILTAAGRVVAIAYTETDAEAIKEALGHVRMGDTPSARQPAGKLIGYTKAEYAKRTRRVGKDLPMYSKPQGEHTVPVYAGVPHDDR